MRGKKGSHGGAGFGFSYDCPICNKRHREGSPMWHKHLKNYEEWINKKETERVFSNL